MVAISKIPKSIYVTGYIAILLFAVWWVLLNYWGHNAPTVPDFTSDSKYEYNYHGTVVYLDFVQQVLRFGLPAVAFLLVFTLSIVEIYTKKQNKEWPPPDVR